MTTSSRQPYWVRLLPDRVGERTQSSGSETLEQLRSSTLGLLLLARALAVSVTLRSAEGASPVGNTMKIWHQEAETKEERVYLHLFVCLAFWSAVSYTADLQDRWQHKKTHIYQYGCIILWWPISINWPICPLTCTNLHYNTFVQEIVTRHRKETKLVQLGSIHRRRDGPVSMKNPSVN